MSSNSVDIKLVLQILELVAAYGVPAVRDIIATWQKESVTVEDVESLKEKLKHPDEY